jgi:glycosyltransferase involved in cell wall biosynthesis
MNGRRLTLAICTHNRPLLLRQLVERLAPDLLQHGIPLIVVDSASAPEAAAGVRQCLGEHPEAQLIRMDAPGVSAARNAALAAVETPWMAFIDDDEMPGDDWVAKTLALLDRLPENCGACGGNVAPHWPGGVAPDPLPGPRRMAYLSMIDQRGEFDQSVKSHFGVGHSLLNVSAVRSVGGFDLRLGRDGSSLLSGEESLLVEALIGRGWRIWHSDRIDVTHIVEPERLVPEWARKRAYWEGVSRARLLSILNPQELRDLERVARRRAPVLRVLRRIAPASFEFDLRSAFVEGVLAEQSGKNIVRRGNNGPDSQAPRSGKRRRTALS